jgi:hypothetical protein
MGEDFEALRWFLLPPGCLAESEPGPAPLLIR